MRPKSTSIALILIALVGAAGCSRHGSNSSVPGENVSGASGSGATGATSGETANSPGGGQSGSNSSAE